ncbi:MAG: inorganic diphosphatase [Candidatus Eremiobacteraeota bacterium]|nr:inorganic diphosphatase [Candidatus Eremiobacteraeota bacterium]
MKQPVNATHYEAIPTRIKNGHQEPRVNAVIETPKNSRHKYALNNEYGIIAFHEVLPDSMEWPYDYGFIPQTIAPDGDPLDVLVITDDGLFSGCLIEVRLIGAVLETKDGTKNHRIIGVPLPSPGAPRITDSMREPNDLPPAMLDEILRFLKTYSERQGHTIVQKGVVGAEEALKLVKQTRKAYKKQR